LKAVLLYNAKKHPSVPLVNAVHMKETYPDIQGLLKKYVKKITSGTYVLA